MLKMVLNEPRTSRKIKRQSSKEYSSVVLSDEGTTVDFFKTTITFSSLLFCPVNLVQFFKTFNLICRKPNETKYKTIFSFYRRSRRSQKLFGFRLRFCVRRLDETELSNSQERNSKLQIQPPKRRRNCPTVINNRKSNRNDIKLEVTNLI